MAISPFLTMRPPAGRRRLVPRPPQSSAAGRRRPAGRARPVAGAVAKPGIEELAIPGRATIQRPHQWTERTIMDTTQKDRLVGTGIGAVSRRAALRGLGGAGFATALGLAAFRGVGAAEATASAMPIEPDAGSRKPWVLASGDQFRLPPPDDAAAADELAELEALAAQRDAAALANIAFWD